MKVIFPKTLADPNTITWPFFFLMGPIKGGGSWQINCLNLLSRQVPGCTVATPTRWYEGHPFTDCRVIGQEGLFESQTFWERRYLAVAAGVETDYPEAKLNQGSCIIAYLPREDETNPRPPGNGPYAQDTYGELGECRGRMIYQPNIRLVVGVENGFPGASTMLKNFRAVKPDFQTYPTLEETVRAAISKTI